MSLFEMFYQEFESNYKFCHKCLEKLRAPVYLNTISTTIG